MDSTCPLCDGAVGGPRCGPPPQACCSRQWSGTASSSCRLLTVQELLGQRWVGVVQVEEEEEEVESRRSSKTSLKRSLPPLHTMTNTSLVITVLWVFAEANAGGRERKTHSAVRSVRKVDVPEGAGLLEQHFNASISLPGNKALTVENSPLLTRMSSKLVLLDKVNVWHSTGTPTAAATAAAAVAAYPY